MTRFDATDRRPVDKWTAAPRPTTSPQGQKPQQKRSTHMVHKPVNSECSRQSAVRLYLGDVLVAEGWIIARFQGENGVFWRWNDDLDCIAKTRREQISGRGAVIAAR